VIQKEHGSFENWLNKNHPKTLEEWVKIFKKQFKFTGGEIVNEFLVSIGYLRGGHDKNCPIYKMIIKQSPAWLKDRK
jgi:DNA-3-methyladenine glycosylase I